ncbi:hypothetical protein KFE25_003353 [Diacronema lutheri]|uniref:Glutaredoxin domain-containing protein n=2 Tax=Diacronema lutheri TaxID=2081491 RepID=A0A8J5XRW0_DIALT|nr:hypothetical protein KFE25_003353 [Diacronema lutheri]
MAAVVAGLCVVAWTTGRTVPACALRRALSAHDGVRCVSKIAGGEVVEVYSTVGCPYCVRAKRKLAELGVPYVELDVTGDEALRERMARRAARTSVPQIFVGAVHVGGCDDLLAAAADGRLDALLDAHGIRRRAPDEASGEMERRTEGGWDVAQLLPRDGVLNHGGVGGPHQPSWLADTAPRALVTAQRGVDAQPSARLASALQRTILALYDDYVTADGSRVDYAQMARSGRLHAYTDLARQLAELPRAELPTERSARLAFWINLYNALVIHGTAVLGAPAGKEGRAAFYSGASGVAYRVAGVRLSLDDMEHGILRGSPPGDARSFARDDPRAALALAREAFDPRVHFALNCGARSCPPIKIYEAANLERALALAARSFCEASVLVDAHDSRVTLSKLFDWYRVDFGQTDDELLANVARYLGDSEAGAALSRALSEGAGRVALQYAEYDWGANAA